jgi:Na+-transporting NADH:ubiquinone oxidoreductase subunit NqrB
MVGSQSNTLAPTTFVKVTAVSTFVFSFNTVAVVPVVSEELNLENWPITRLRLPLAVILFNQAEPKVIICRGPLIHHSAKWSKYWKVVLELT